MRCAAQISTSSSLVRSTVDGSGAVKAQAVFVLEGGGFGAKIRGKGLGSVTKGEFAREKYSKRIDRWSIEALQLRR